MPGKYHSYHCRAHGPSRAYGRPGERGGLRRAHRTFSAQEATIALSASSPFKPGVERGYPVLLEAANAAHVSTTMTFLDATRIFDAEPSPVYVDDCCHYTLRGNQLLADFIAKGVLASSGPWSAAR